MKKHLLSLLLLATVIVSAQEEKSQISVEKKLTRIVFLDPGISYEYGLGNKTTLYSSLSLYPIYFGDSKQIKNWGIAPNINEDLRYYYNLVKRVRKNKNISGNSGNYISLLAIYGLTPIGKTYSYTDLDGLTLAPTWGFQRTYKSGFNLSLNLGYGYNFSPYQSVRGEKIVGNFIIGWVLR